MRLQRIGGAAAVCAAAVAFTVIGTSLTGNMTVAAQQGPTACPVSYAELKDALVAADVDDSTGLNNHYWGVVVNRQGVVCAVAYSGDGRDGQWLLSRQIAAAKAF